LWAENVNDNGESPAATLGPIDPLSLGAALARSVLERSRDLSPGIVEFAARMNVPRERLQAELGYVAIITMHFCIGVVFARTVRTRRSSTGFIEPCGRAPSGVRRNAAGARDCASISIF
jgi:hypothetical protein